MKKQSIFLGMYLFFVLCVCVNMGDTGGKYGSRLLEPSFAPLEEGQGSYHGRVIDETTTAQIRDLSFFGHTNVGGILKESDDSVNKLELSKIKEINIVNANYDSKRYGDKELILTTITTIDGTKVKDILIPKHIVICGKEKETNMEKSWFIGKINKLIVDHEAIKKDLIPRVPAAVEPIAKVEKVEQKIKPDKQVEKVKMKNYGEDTPKKEKSVIGAFIAIIDSIIDFFKAVIIWIWNLRKL
ncbi:MAG: hypothetical protein V1855_01680 [bacterium]